MTKRGWPTDHITYDPNLKMMGCEYEIIRSSTHDGTLLFSHGLRDSATHGLAFKQSFYKPRAAELTDETWDKIRYVVGPLKVAIAYGMVNLPCSKTSKYAGQRECVRISVRMVTDF
jgi:hypothetical protein